MQACVRVCPVVEVVNNATSPLKFYTEKKKSQKPDQDLYNSPLSAFSHTKACMATDTRQKQKRTTEFMKMYEL